MPDSPVGRAPRAEGVEKFQALMQAVQVKLEEGHLAEALLALTALHDNPIVPPEQVQKVTRLLDQLAGTVVYSRQHLLEPPYRVRPGETLEQIAETYQVPWQLLAKINGVHDPLQPGQELKVVRGPFNALVNLDKFELTLMVGGRYAGRFPIGIGRDYSHVEGSYVVHDKVLNPTGFNARTSPGAGDPNSQLPGTYWIDLGGRLGIHGTSNPQDLHRSGGQGSICLGQRDIEDVYGILSVGSRVIIRR
jgi:lipoprotein-anchoring transpeptidase ErfK/SrfK